MRGLEGKRRGRAGPWLVATLLVTSAALWVDGCTRNWDAYDPRLGNGGSGAGGAATGGKPAASSSSGAPTSTSGPSSTGSSSSSSGWTSSSSSSSSSSTSSGVTTSSSSTSSSSGGPVHCGGTNVLTNFVAGDPSGVWQLGPPMDPSVSETNGAATVSLPNAGPAWRGNLLSYRYYDLRSDAISVEVDTSKLATASSAEVSLTAALYPEYIGIYEQSGALHCVQSLNDGGTVDHTPTLAYDAVAQRYWRLQEAGGTTSWEASADGVTWTALATTPTAALFPLDYVQIELAGATTNNTTTNPGSVTFSNLNQPGGGAGKWCPTSSLKDDFMPSGSAVPPVQWARSYTAPTATFSETGGQLLFHLEAYDGEAHSEFWSAASYDLTLSAVVVHVGPGAAPAQTNLLLQGPASNALTMVVNDTHQLAVAYGAGSTFPLKSAPYDPVQHAWWKIAHTGTSIVWQTSADGTTWTTFYELSPVPIPIDAFDIHIGAGHFTELPVAVTCSFDHFNL